MLFDSGVWWPNELMKCQFLHMGTDAQGRGRAQAVRGSLSSARDVTIWGSLIEESKGVANGTRTLKDQMKELGQFNWVGKVSNGEGQSSNNRRATRWKRELTLFCYRDRRRVGFRDTDFDSNQKQNAVKVNFFCGICHWGDSWILTQTVEWPAIPVCD